MNKICFEKQAEAWEEALPIGNGRMGAMIFGNVCRERLQLNGDSIWYGGPQNRINPDALCNLSNIRKLILEDENIPEAEKLIRYTMSGTPSDERIYQSAGDLWLDWGKPSVSDYARELDLEEGIVKVKYTMETIGMEKEYFSSFPDQVMVVHLKSDTAKGLSFTAMMTREKYYDGTGKLEENTIKLWGNCGDGGVQFLIAIKAETIGGSARVCGEHLLIEGADEVTLYITIETSFYENGNLEKAALYHLNQAAEQGYERIKTRHIADYQDLYNRVEFSLGALEQSSPMLEYVESYFQFGRYLCIAASRPGSLPGNLQGLWNESMTPSWGSKYTININTEMNYWPVESCSLPECHQPLFEHLKKMRIRGREVAAKMYGCRGFAAHHNTDIWADCAPQDIYMPASYWVMGGAWLSTHIWTHYAYTQDKAFLAEMYPVLKDAVMFFHDYLVEVDGQMLTCPSVSPENTYLLPSGMHGCMGAGTTMDNQILRDLFGDYIKAAKVLRIEEEEVEKTKEILKKLPQNRIGKHGQLMEWRNDYEEMEPGHRHISHLYGLHPSHQITLDKTPELAKAAQVTLQRRLEHGGGHTGWSCAWIVNLYARLADGENAWINLKKMFEKSTFPNRMSNHPSGSGFVFQIDGNYGAVSGIAEMLLQSDEDRTILLPAIPAEWSEGKIKGLSMVGGGTVDISWKSGTIISAVIHAKKELKTVVCWEGKREKIELALGEERELV